jgi:8-oxo-dGTP diphosphatase
MRYSGKTATAIIAYPENRILLIKRSTAPFAGYWALPGGRSEPEETAEQTIVREVKEETGLDIAVISKIGEYHEQGVQAGLEYDYYATCYLTKQVGGAIKGQESEVSDIQLFSLECLPKALAFEHAQMIKDYVLRIEQK